MATKKPLRKPTPVQTNEASLRKQLRELKREFAAMKEDRDNFQSIVDNAMSATHRYKEDMINLVAERDREKARAKELHGEITELQDIIDKMRPEAQTPAPAPKLEGVAATLAERGNRYGRFEDHSRAAQMIQHAIETFSKPHLDDDGQELPFTNYYSPWHILPPIMQRALTTIADKIARVLNGDAYYQDNWHDIQGYAKLVEDFCKKEALRQKQQAEYVAAMAKTSTGAAFARNQVAMQAQEGKPIVGAVEMELIRQQSDSPLVGLKALDGEAKQYITPVQLHPLFNAAE